MYKTYLFAHVIWAIRNKETQMSKPIRVVLFSHLQKMAEEKGIKILQVMVGRIIYMFYCNCIRHKIWHR